MATTTPNYGWSVPTSTDLVKDGATAIETLGDSVDATVKALNPETTLGDIAYRSATANTNTRLAIGTTGQILTVAGGVPSWAAPAGGGKLLQVVQATTTTTMTSTSTTFADSNLTGTITPTLSTSKVLVLVSQHLRVYRGSQFQGGSWQLLRGASAILTYNYASSQGFMGIEANGATDTTLVQVGNMTYLDSPATTSATTYKTQIAVGNTASSGFMRAQGDSVVSTITLMEIGA
jgi:hypothetical protein